MSVEENKAIVRRFFILSHTCCVIYGATFALG